MRPVPDDSLQRFARASGARTDHRSPAAERTPQDHEAQSVDRGARTRRAREVYAALGVDIEAALGRLDQVAISMHCWQGDDVRGFENPDGAVTGGIAATGDYPGRARNADELRADADLAMAQIPGPKRFNLHAIYLEASRPVERTEHPAGALPALGRLGQEPADRPGLQPHAASPIPLSEDD